VVLVAEADRELVGEPDGVLLVLGEAEELREELDVLVPVADVDVVLVEVDVLETVEEAVEVREVVADKLLFAD
jgi:hypothetical protein